MTIPNTLEPSVHIEPPAHIEYEQFMELAAKKWREHNEHIDFNLAEMVNVQLLAALDKLAPDKILERFEDRFFTDLKNVSEALLGIDRSWSRMEIHDKGLITKMITPQIETMVQEKALPKVIELCEKY